MIVVVVNRFQKVKKKFNKKSNKKRIDNLLLYYR